MTLECFTNSRVALPGSTSSGLSPRFRTMICTPKKRSLRLRVSCSSWESTARITPKFSDQRAYRYLPSLSREKVQPGWDSDQRNVGGEFFLAVAENGIRAQKIANAMHPTFELVLIEESDLLRP